MNKYLKHIACFALIGLNLISCNNITTNNKPVITGIYSIFYEYGNDNNLIKVSNINIGDCAGKEEYVYTYLANTNDTYILQIYPSYTNSSKTIALSGDSASITPNANYNFSYCDEFSITSYKFNFLNEGTYRINISINDFDDKFDVIVNNSSH